MTQPSTYQNSLNTLQEKQETVLELTAVSAAASTAITVLPGDVATPIALGSDLHAGYSQSVKFLRSADR